MKKLYIIFAFVIILLGPQIYMAQRALSEVDPDELFTFELKTNEHGEQYYIVKDYIGFGWSFKKITVPSEYNGIPVYAIGESAFSGACVGSVTLSEGIVEIGKFAFERAGMKEIILPESVENIGFAAFRDAENLKKVILPHSLKIISEEAFFGCSALKEVALPANLEVIDKSAFAYCKQLKEIYIPQSVQVVKCWAFYNCVSLHTVEISEGVQIIEFNAFLDCESLKKVTIPSSITAIDFFSFSGCGNLEEIKYRGEEESWTFEISCPEDCKIVFLNKKEQSESENVENNDTEDKKIVEELSKSLRFELNENGTYYRVIGVLYSTEKNLTIPEMYNGIPVKEIADKAFDGCSNLETISIPQSIITVGNSVFYGCDKLTSVSMPAVQQMDKGAFTGCSSIKDLTIPADFLGYVKSQPLESITITHVKTTNICASAFSKHQSLKKVTISQGITTIGKEAFTECDLLEKVVLPEGLCVVGQWAFAFCPMLKDIILPSTLQEIHLVAFRDCTSLTEVVIPKSVDTIGDGAFYGCSSLHKVTIENGVSKIGSNYRTPGTFGECNIKEIVIPESVIYINQGAFEKNPLERAIFKNAAGWKIRSSIDSLLAKDIDISERELSNPEYAAGILLQLYGNYMSRR